MVEGAFKALAYDKQKERLLVTDQFGHLVWVLLDDERAEAASRSGALSGIAIAPGGNGYYVLFEDGTVHAEGGAVYFGDAKVSRTQYAVDIEVDPSSKGYHVLLSDGEVVSLGEVVFPGWRKRLRGVYAAFTVDASGETWFGLTRGGGMVWAGREPGIAAEEDIGCRRQRGMWGAG